MHAFSQSFSCEDWLQNRRNRSNFEFSVYSCVRVVVVVVGDGGDDDDDDGDSSSGSSSSIFFHLFH